MAHELSPLIESALDELVFSASQAPKPRAARHDATVRHMLEVVRGAIRCEYGDFLASRVGGSEGPDAEMLAALTA